MCQRNYVNWYRKQKILILDKIAFSSEQEYKRTEQRLQELTAQKDRVEKSIANILNGEGYSKLKQFIKENVKVVLSEKRTDVKRQSTND